jgi:hypothetical protein
LLFICYIYIINHVTYYVCKCYTRQARRSAPRIVSYTRTRTPHVSYHIVFHIRSYRLRIIVQHARHTHTQWANVRTLTQHSSSDSTGQNPESILHFHGVGSNLTYRITISDTHGANETDFLLYPVAKKIVYNTLLIYMSYTYLHVTKNFLLYFFWQGKI